jgi:hypothetical protein
MRGAALVAILAATLLAGCGASAEGDVEDTVHTYFEAVAKGRGAQACNVLTRQGTQQLFDSLDQAGDVSGLGCPEAIERASSQFPPEFKRTVGKLEVSDVDVDGDRATATFGGGEGSPAKVSLRRVEDRWLIDGPAAAPTRSAGKPPAKEEVIDSADSVCRTATEQLSKLGEPPSSSDLDAAGRYRDRARPILERAVRALEGIPSSQRDGALFDRYVASAILRERLADEAFAQLARGDEPTARRTFARQRRVEELGSRAAEAYGLHVCR